MTQVVSLLSRWKLGWTLFVDFLEMVKTSLSFQQGCFLHVFLYLASSWHEDADLKSQFTPKNSLEIDHGTFFWKIDLKFEAFFGRPLFKSNNFVRRTRKLYEQTSWWLGFICSREYRPITSLGPWICGVERVRMPWVGNFFQEKMWPELWGNQKGFLLVKARIKHE